MQQTNLVDLLDRSCPLRSRGLEVVCRRRLTAPPALNQAREAFARVENVADRHGQISIRDQEPLTQESQVSGVYLPIACSVSAVISHRPVGSMMHSADSP